MSDTLKNKMHELEVPPPAMVWEHIVQSLDELATQKNLSQKLYNLEIPAPITTWATVSNALDQSLTGQEYGFKDDLLNLEVQAPISAWQKIVHQLDEPILESLSKKMYDYEVKAPAQAWEKITAALNEEATPIIPLRNNYNKIFRFAAAAAIIGIMAWAGFSLLNVNKESTDSSLADNNIKSIEQTTKTPSKTAIETIPEKTKETIAVTTTPEKNNTTNFIKPAQSKNNLVQTSPRGTTRSIDVDDPDFSISTSSEEGHTSSNDIAVSDVQNLHKKNKPSAVAADGNTTEARYLVYLTDNGDMVKLSKKLADLKCIYNKDGSISQDAMASLNEAACNDQLKYWQEKVANSSLQSSSNPLELIQILK